MNGFKHWAGILQHLHAIQCEHISMLSHQVPSRKTMGYPPLLFCPKASGLPMQCLNLAIVTSRSGTWLNFFLAEQQV